MVRNITLDVIAKKRSEELDKLAAQFDKTANEIDKTSASARRHTTTLDVLNREIETTRTRVRELGEEYNKTGSVDAFRNLRSAKRDLNDFERLAREVGKSLEKSTDQGESGFKHLRQTVMSGLSDMTQGIPVVGGAFAKMFAEIPPEISIPVTLVVGTGLVTTAVAAAGGAALGALGLGGIGTGIALQLKGPEVSSALSSLGAKIRNTFEADSHGFGIQVMHGIQLLNSELDRLDPKLSAIFANLQTYVSPLVQGFAKGIDGLVSGIETASGRIGPVITIIAHDVGMLGQKAGEAIAIISQGSRGGAEALHQILTVVGDIIIGVAKVIVFFENAYDKLLQFDAGLSKVEAKLLGWVPIVGDKIREHAKASDNLAHSTEAASLSTDDLTGSMSGLYSAETIAAGSTGLLAGQISNAATNTARWNQIIDTSLSKNLALDQSALSSKLAVAQFAEAVKGNSHAMEGNSAAALGLRSQLLNAIGTLQATRDAQIRAGGSAKDATTAYNNEVAKLLDLAKKAGLSEDALNKLAGEYYVDVVTTYSSRGTPPRTGGYGDITTGRIGGYAAGGPVRAGVPILVGEEGPEILVPKTAGTIIPNKQAMGSGAAWGAGGGIHITVIVPPMADPAEAGRQVVEAIRAYERRSGSTWRAL